MTEDDIKLKISWLKETKKNEESFEPSNKNADNQNQDKLMLYNGGPKA